MSNLKKEVMIYFIVLIVMAGIWHNVTLPEKITLIFSSSRMFHPLEWSMVGYLILWIPRGIYMIVKKTIFSKSIKNDNMTAE